MKIKFGAGVFGMLFAVSSWADDAYIGAAVEALPIFDAHVHYKAPAWEPYPPETIIGLMDKSGVAMGLVSSTPDEGTIRLWRYAPQRVVPELRPYHGDYGSSNWTTMPDMAGYLEKRLDAYPHEGIGEFHLHRVDVADHTLLKKVAAMAVQRDLYLHVHSGAAPISLLFSIQPKLKIIWAHAGMTESASVVATMMQTYQTLWADTSFREGDILAPDGTIDARWREVLETYPDRFMVGSDTWVNSQWANYEEIIATNRRWLAQFSRAHAEQFAYKNAERLFQRKVAPGSQ